MVKKGTYLLDMWTPKCANKCSLNFYSVNTEQRRQKYEHFLDNMLVRRSEIMDIKHAEIMHYYKYKNHPLTVKDISQPWN